MLEKNNIKIGTSGYSFDDWYGNFYPPGIQKTKMLDYYKDFFDTVEINSTYYHVPVPIIMQRINDKTNDKFQFIVKMPMLITHQLNTESEIINSFKKALYPMIESKKLKGVLAQFPYAFKNSISHIDYLKQLKDQFNETPLFIEFRHKSWQSDMIFQMLEKESLGYVTVDAPLLNGLFPLVPHVTNQTGYFRLHGRNAQTWWNSASGDRYDYLYSEDEIRSFIPIIKSLAQRSNSLYIFFNNCHAGKAITNAQFLKQILSIEF